MTLEAPLVQQSLSSQAPRMRQRALRQGSTSYREWSLLTAHGTRPTRLAQMSVCKVIRNFVLVYFSKYLWDKCTSCVIFRPYCFLTYFGFCVFLLDLLQVELKMRKTCFWRHQKGKPDSYLATIEAIYYFLRDYHKYCLGQEYDGEYDNLLYFYSFLHSVVNKAKTERKTWATKTSVHDLESDWDTTSQHAANTHLTVNKHRLSSCLCYLYCLLLKNCMKGGSRWPCYDWSLPLTEWPLG